MFTGQGLVEKYSASSQSSLPFLMNSFALFRTMASDFSEPPPLILTHIFHPTDLSLSPDIACADALKLTIAKKAKLTVFHVNKALETTEVKDFPHFHDMLARWGYGSEERASLNIGKLCIPVETILAHGDDPTASILAYLSRHPAGLIVLATHQFEGQPIFPSVAEPVARGGGVRPYSYLQTPVECVRSEYDSVNLRNILNPVDNHPNPQPPLQAILGLVHAIESENMANTLLHVG